MLFVCLNILCYLFLRIVFLIYSLLFKESQFEIIINLKINVFIVL